MRDPSIANPSCQDAANNNIFSGPDDLWGNGDATNRETGCVSGATYDGSQVRVGHNFLGPWMTSIDVIAHELGHGIDDHTPGGISAGGTKEFVADAFGAATEWFANEPSPFDVPDFTVGEQTGLTVQTRFPVTTGSTWSPKARTRPTASRRARSVPAPLSPS